MAGAEGKRFALPNAKIMVHQPSGGFQGQATAIEIHARYGEVERAQVIYEEAREADPPFAPGELGDLRQELENSLQWRLEREESE